MPTLLEQFQSRLAAAAPDVSSSLLVVPDADHGSVYLPAVAQGLARLTEGWKR